MARVCIICGNEVKSGSAVADDLVIQGIRRAKQTLHIAKNNELVVCEDDLESHRKKRQGYERNLALYVVIAGIVFVFLVIVPIFTTGFSAYSLILGILLAALLIVLPVVTSHTPALEGMAAKQAEGATKSKAMQSAMVAKKAKAAPKKKGKR